MANVFSPLPLGLNRVSNAALSCAQQQSHPSNITCRLHLMRRSHSLVNHAAGALVGAPPSSRSAQDQLSSLAARNGGRAAQHSFACCQAYQSDCTPSSSGPLQPNAVPKRGSPLCCSYLPRSSLPRHRKLLSSRAESALKLFAASHAAAGSSSSHNVPPGGEQGLTLSSASFHSGAAPAGRSSGRKDAPYDGNTLQANGKLAFQLHCPSSAFCTYAPSSPSPVPPKDVKDGELHTVNTAIYVNSAIFVAKCTAWSFSGSASMLAEAVHSAVDIVNQVAACMLLLRDSFPC